MKPVDVYFDFISPYAYLAFEALPGLEARHQVSLRYRPIVFGAVLSARGLVGPVENEAKRRYTYVDVLRRARAQGVPFAGVPAHPFRSLEALRTVCLFAGDDRLGDLVRGIARAGWGEGRDLTQVETLAEVVASVGLDAGDLGQRIQAPEIKRALVEGTRGALQAGVFGVPTFGHDGELFWGHDRMNDLERRLAGEGPVDVGLIEDLLARPRAVDRPEARGPSRRS